MLVIGLYQPNRGEMYIDGVLTEKSNLQNWRPQTGYIPQQIYLFDGTISENVCFGRDLEKNLLELKGRLLFELRTAQSQIKEVLNNPNYEG